MNIRQWIADWIAPAERRNDFYQLVTLMDGNRSYAGPLVNEENSMRFAPVWACVGLISGSIASLPLHLYRRVGRTKEKATDHPLYNLLHDMANPEQTATEFRQLMLMNVLLWGTSFANVEHNKRGTVSALWPLFSKHISEAARRNGLLYYKHQPYEGGAEWLAHEGLFITRGISGSGFFGYSPIEVAAKQATGSGLAMEQYGARFFGNGARPGGILKYPGRLSKEAKNRIRDTWYSEHGGADKAHSLKILEEGMDYDAIEIPPEAAQFLQSRKFQVSDIARIFQVPPHMVGDLENATFTNIEHQGLEFVKYTLGPWLVRIEQAIWRDLLTPGERMQYFAKHSVEGLLRGDAVTRGQFYSTMVNTGAMTRNEVREFEDLNPLDGLDEPLQQLNLTEAGQAPLALPDSRNEIRAERRYEIRQDKIRTINRYVSLFGEAAGRLVRRETANIRREARRFLQNGNDIDGFREWLAGFYSDLRGVIPDYFDALMTALAGQMFEIVGEELGADPPEPDDLDGWIGRYLENFAAVHAVGGEKQINALLEGADDAEAANDAVLERMDGWEDNRASKTALEQAYEAGNALSILGYSTLGVRELIWQGGDCPLCRKLNGVRIPIGGAFAQAGDEIEADDDDTASLPVIRTIRHGPLHGGCDCTVRAG